MKQYEVVIIGGGPAGLAAAIEARKNGVQDILVLERDHELGGILNQCIHNGFGLHIFKEQLSGPTYAERFIEQLCDLGIEYKLNSMVLNISRDRVVDYVNRDEGYCHIQAKTVILAMGCRERTRGNITIPGARPAGIYTAGAAQRLLNIDGYMVGKKIVILGSGDIGLIMARRMTLEGAKVEAVIELMPYSGGLNRNIVQCLHDFDIPLYLSHTIVDIEGKERVEGLTVMQVDEHKKPIPGTEKHYDCDTLLLSVGLIPENELSLKAGIELDPVTKGPKVTESMETSVPGVFACGNVVHVHDIVDFVTQEAQRAGKGAADYLKSSNREEASSDAIAVAPAADINYIVPQKIYPEHVDKSVKLFMRVRDVYRNRDMVVYGDGKELLRMKKSYLAPGEMETVAVPAKFLENIHELSVGLEG